MNGSCRCVLALVYFSLAISVASAKESAAPASADVNPERKNTATPCSGINRQTGASNPKLNSVIARQLSVEHVEVLQSFYSRNWTILYVNSAAADPAFLFYDRDPFERRFVALWSGGATTSEEPSIKAWAGTHAPGIPDDLAECFAWHVTYERNR